MTTASLIDRAALVRTIASQHLTDRGPLLPVLHEVMDELGYVAREDVQTIADVLNLSIAEVHGVVSFYQDFRTSPPAAHAVALCRGEACQSVGPRLFTRTRSPVPRRSGLMSRSPKCSVWATAHWDRPALSMAVYMADCRLSASTPSRRDGVDIFDGQGVRSRRCGRGLRRCRRGGCRM